MEGLANGVYMPNLITVFLFSKTLLMYYYKRPDTKTLLTVSKKIPLMGNRKSLNVNIKYKSFVKKNIFLS